MTLLLALHALVAALALSVLRRQPRVGAWLGVAVLAATAVYAVAAGTTAEPRGESWIWVEALGWGIHLRLDSFAVLMVLIVSVLGAFVLAYATTYFDMDQRFVRFVGIFVLFAGAMNGLVMSADLFTMFVFWEITSVTSFLLIGLNDESATARFAALRALLVTGAGGLCLLAGLSLIQNVAGTTAFVDLATNTPAGTVIDVALVLVLVGAFTKSAQFPFHFWLPGAMAAPTPVSAYLHSATMVKAGIVLIARMAPIFGDRALWQWLIVGAGVATIMIGGARALGQTDAKLLLAHSTVSQLGLLTILFGIGVPIATYAGVAHLLAHAVFKAGLFLGVGMVDHSFGTRDIAVLSGVGRRMRTAMVMGGLATASMAGIIPLFGFATKEKSLAALLKTTDYVGAAGTVALIGVVAGSMLTVAYSIRLFVGMFGTKPEVAETELHHAPSLGLWLPVYVISLASLVFGLWPSAVGRLLDAPASSLDAQSAGELVLWPGVNTAFALSVVIVIVGVVIARLVPLRLIGSRIRLSGEEIFRAMYDGLLEFSRVATSRIQTGSLLAYIAVTLLVISAALVVGVLAGFDADLLDGVIWFDSAAQLVIAVSMAVLALVVVFIEQRFVAALVIGGVGLGCAALFALHGAPDLALTQVLVETMTIVVFLLVLRQVPQRFEAPPRWAPRVLRVGIAVAVGGVVALFAALVSGSRTAPSSGISYADLSLPEAGGKNIVNVILVDFRGFDTFGEITVLAVAALGVANLVKMARREKSPVGDQP
jgi:multicomponent Na+:H+ antiporter subunit A